MSPVTDREHADLQARVGRVEERIDDVADRVDKVESRFDRLDGMVILVKAILGTSLIAAIAGVLSLIDLISRHS